VQVLTSAVDGIMHVQTATTTMAQPNLPASPTLTNPDMILPYSEEFDKGYGMPSPGDDWNGDVGFNMPFSIGTASHMGPSGGPLTTPIIYGNGTMLSDIGEVTEAESTPGRKLPGPAERRMLKQSQIGSARGSFTSAHSALVKRTKGILHERKSSMESNSTVTSGTQAAELFKDFDDGVSVDDSCFQGDDEESVADSHSEQVIASETKRLAQRDSVIEAEGREEDPNSSAALSRRAEQILSNAKKRLNVSFRLSCTHCTN
jgi:hypothetical protein